MNKRSVIASIALITIGLVFGVVLVSAIGNSFGVQSSYAKGTNANVTLGGPAPKLQNTGDIKSINTLFSSVSKAVLPSVVNIRVVAKEKGMGGMGGHGASPHNFFFRFFGPNGEENGDPNGGEDGEEGPGQDHETAGAGSGVIISADGYILTNNHVVENATSVKIYTYDRHQYEAKVIGTDPSTDLAVLKVEATGLTPAALGNSDELDVGNWVVAVGNPFELSSTVTAGIISAKARPLPGLIKEDSKKHGNSPITDFLQTDAAINPGNSGGGLFDLNGMLVGINSAIATTSQAYQGYGFAIPVNIARTVAEDLIKNGSVHRGYIGVTIGEVDDAMAEALKLDRPHGVFVNEAKAGSAGEKAGLKTSDVILSVEGREVNTPSEIQGIVAQHHAGDRVILQVWRDAKEIEVPVVLKSLNDEPETASADNESTSKEKKNDVADNKTTANFDQLGFAVRNVDDKTKSDLDIEGGVRVTTVKPYTDAYNRGIQVNDVIVKADNKSVSTAGQLEKLVNSKKSGETVLFIVKSKAGTRLVALRTSKPVDGD